MSTKVNILESWIMVEHLSEGDINLKDRSILTFSQLQDEDYYSMLINEIQKKKLEKYRHSGVVVYFDIFSFQDIVDFLRKEYKLAPTNQDIVLGNKFSFALYFDKNLNFVSEMTFLTESYYIRKNKRIPKENDFLAFESEKKKIFEELFECPEDMDYSTHFNNVISSILTQNNVSIKNCRMKALINMESDAANLHSFFIADLEKAKNIQSHNLDKYIMGNNTKHIDLDCRMKSDKFNPSVFYNILQPRNYPIARFPSNPKFSLALMQQVAVNLAIGFDNEQIRSVNGPPGTGKTTLLKDIFAELIVEQAHEIVSLSSKYIRGNDTTKYWENASIGIMPRTIADKGIVVASSNHGAVQNIVNELPLTDKIDKEFIDDIVSADYFKKIANSFLETEWIEDETGKHERLIINEKEENNRFWGLFSLEGGRKDNMEYMVTVLKHVAYYLEKEYIPNDDIYQNFIELHDEVCGYRNKIQTVSQEITNLNELLVKIDEKCRNYDNEVIIRKNKSNQYILEKTKAIEGIQGKVENLEIDINDFNLQLQKTECDKNSVIQCIEALKLQKPRFFSPRKLKIEFREKNRIYSDKLQNVIHDESMINSNLIELERQIRGLQAELEKNEREAKQEKAAFSKWEESEKSDIQRLKDEAKKTQEKVSGFKINELNLNLDYETLQLSNPWFGIEYRRLQSQLFIKALQVRKQFLYENVKNIKAAYIIWSKQKDYLEHKLVISEAWNWMNMVIPVIGSTFASFSRMCVNMGKETIGHLFVDEAGQALPQASAGAIFRSKHVMAVGDPSQIKPVLTLDSNILNMLGKYYGVSQKYLSENASTQTLVDAVSQYGFYKDCNRENWIGIPLWVHRRCKYPMFDIANKISYCGNMVQGDKVDGISEWYDIGGHASDKYVSEQGIFLREKIQNMIVNNPDIIDKQKEDIIYVISPFKNVAYQLSQELKKIGFTRYDDKGKPTNIGTVHTFQGKEAPIVFLVLGADAKSTGAANWAMGTENPNIMNVAATRAKDEFYIIGDKNLYLSLKSDVINDTYKIIENFKAKVSYDNCTEETKIKK